MKVGDTVEADQSILTLESDKASMEIPAPKAGVVKSLKVKLGDRLKEGDELLELEIEGAAAAEEADGYQHTHQVGNDFHRCFKTTPGPLIMVVTFVGFVAGWTTQFAADGMPLLSALCGALIATFFTFLPSFLFILAGAPFIEGTRHKAGLKGPLTGITAAVVGVMLSLALFFAGHVFITREQRFDWIAIAVAAVALVLLTRWKVGVLTILGLAAAFGLARWWA